MPPCSFHIWASSLGLGGSSGEVTGAGSQSDVRVRKFIVTLLVPVRVTGLSSETLTHLP